MNSVIKLTSLCFFVCGVLFISGCTTREDETIHKINHKPVIEPDYSDVTIPPNIAPMNFVIREDGSIFTVNASDPSGAIKISVKSKNGIIRFSERSWKKLLLASRGDKITFQINSLTNDKKNTNQFDPFFMHVSNDSIDPFLVYRIINPGYYSWSKIKIEQRSLESFNVESLIENQVIEKNCVNCHSFSQNNPEKFLVHIRGSKGGTYFMENGEIIRKNLKTENMPGGATYPAWNPDGRFVAFSSNQVRQSFYAHVEKSIEVYDLVSTLILFDTKTNEIFNITGQDSLFHLETFPSWSPDGKYLYFCTATQLQPIEKMDFSNIKNIHYNLARKSFDATTRSFGETEIVFNASEINKSVSFPRISPDGKLLVITVHDYGTFPIWHQEADLYLINSENNDWKKMDLNSNMTESYHAWSSNGKWLVFSSKRLDGRTTRPFFAHIDSSSSSGKPFVLPQKDPTTYNRMLESFNIPELITGKIGLKPLDFVKASKQEAVQAISGDSAVMLKWDDKKTIRKNPDVERGVHE